MNPHHSACTTTEKPPTEAEEMSPKTKSPAKSRKPSSKHCKDSGDKPKKKSKKDMLKKDMLLKDTLQKKTCSKDKTSSDTLSKPILLGLLLQETVIAARQSPYSFQIFNVVPHVSLMWRVGVSFTFTLGDELFYRNRSLLRSPLMHRFTLVLSVRVLSVFL